MWVLCAPSGFKGRMTAVEACARVLDELRALPVEVDACPLADGGRGTLDALAVALELDWSRCEATRLDGVTVSARFGTTRDGIAVIESAEVVGLTLVAKGARRPRDHTSRGVGELVRAAIGRGAREVWVGLGDTGVVDGGRGMMEALVGVSLAGVRLRGLADVNAPLVGESGARRFMVQKGVRPDELDEVERELAALHPRFLHAPGAGAAGGLGAAILALGGTLESGARAIGDAVGLDARVARAALALSGEGALDRQTLQGKALAHLAAACRAHRVPLVALCGRVELDAQELRAAGIVEARALGDDARLTIGAAAHEVVARQLAISA